MQFTIVTVLFTLFAMLSTALNTLASPILLKRDVYNPPILSPSAGDSFYAGEMITVIWDASVLPADFKNEGRILLGYKTEGSISEHLDVEHPLASDFLLTEGSKQVTLPKNLPTRSSYILILMGDSGNASEKFTINARQ